MLARADDGQHVNPARAGMIPLFDANWAVIDCKPRASGDDPPESLMRVDVEV